MQETQVMTQREQAMRAMFILAQELGKAQDPPETEDDRNQKPGDLNVDKQRGQITRLATLELTEPLDAIVELDEDWYLAEAPRVPGAAGVGDTQDAALRNLAADIEDLYHELCESDSFTEDWLQLRTYLKSIIKE